MGQRLCSMYQTKHVTPYAHAFAMHVPEFVGTHGNISKFCQQGLEKLNDVTTLHYLRGTNHKKREAFVQMLQTRNRLEDLKAKGYQRQNVSVNAVTVVKLVTTNGSV